MFIIIIATVVFMALLIGGGVWKLYQERKKLEMDKNTNEESLSNALLNINGGCRPYKLYP